MLFEIVGKADARHPFAELQRRLRSDLITARGESRIEVGLRNDLADRTHRECRVRVDHLLLEQKAHRALVAHELRECP